MKNELRRFGPTSECDELPPREAAWINLRETIRVYVRTALAGGEQLAQRMDDDWIKSGGRWYKTYEHLNETFRRAIDYLEGVLRSGNVPIECHGTTETGRRAVTERDWDDKVIDWRRDRLLNKHRDPVLPDLFHIRVNAKKLREHLKKTQGKTAAEPTDKPPDRDEGGPQVRPRRLIPERPLNKRKEQTAKTAAYDVLKHCWPDENIPGHLSEQEIANKANEWLKKNSPLDPNDYALWKADKKGTFKISVDSVARVLVPRQSSNSAGN
jgi:hypothetical protein